MEDIKFLQLKGFLPRGTNLKIISFFRNRAFNKIDEFVKVEKNIIIRKNGQVLNFETLMKEEKQYFESYEYNEEIGKLIFPDKYFFLLNEFEEDYYNLLKQELRNKELKIERDYEYDIFLDSLLINEMEAQKYKLYKNLLQGLIGFIFIIGLITLFI